MTKTLMMATKGYPLKVVEGNLVMPRIIGIISFLSGIILLITIILLAGCTKSKNMGEFTTVVGILTLLLIHKFSNRTGR